MSDNPLKQYFRKPQLFIKLPSNGRFWPEGSLTLPATGELPVLSMTASDELYLMTPDALMNGDAVVSLIQNCMPNIIDAWQTPSVDLETILVSIRIASVGDKLGIESTCPKCKESREYDIDLKSLALIESPDIWESELTLGNLTLNFRPLSFQILNNYNQSVFQIRKRLQQIPDIEDPDIKEQITNQTMNDYSQLDLQFIIDTIVSIRADGHMVTNSEHIAEFISNCDKKTYSKIRDHVEKLKATTHCQEVDSTCADCGHRYATNITLDYTSFFELGS